MKLLLVDGHYYAYRSFYAIQHLKNSRGEPTNMLYGFTKALRRMLAEVQPDRALVVMDGGLPAERLAAQADYKANRVETPEALVQQLPQLETLVPALGVTLLCVPGEEADDVIASYTVRARAEGCATVIATNDKDIMQLVDPQVRIYQPAADGFTLLDEAGVREKWGVGADKIGEVLRLTGDSVDNIPGVPGIGPKTAAALVNQFGSVDILLTRLGEIKSEKQRAALEQSRDLLERNRTMVTLRSSLPLPAPIDSLRLRPDYARQAEIFRALEFKTFTREAEAELARSTPPRQADLFA